MIDILDISCKISLKSTLVQVMGWCRQAPSHYLNQCWPGNNELIPLWGYLLSAGVLGIIYRACSPGCLDQIKTARQDGLTTAPTFFRELNAFLIMLKFSDSYETYRICSQQYLHSIWIVFGCMGCWGVGWGVPIPSRRTHDRPRLTRADALVCLQLNTYLMMLEYSDSYETYRISLQQYLDLIWIVLGCMGCWGVGWGGAKPVTTDSRPTRADALKYIIN